MTPWKPTKRGKSPSDENKGKRTESIITRDIPDRKTGYMDQGEKEQRFEGPDDQNTNLSPATGATMTGGKSRVSFRKRMCLEKKKKKRA